MVSRQKRKLSQSGLYHIIFKGISRQNIFEEDADYIKLKEILKKVKDEMDLVIYAYCFMTNHVHLFLKEKESGDISKVMTKVLSHYATWFNIKYLRSGALFCNRYKSEPVEDENYYLSLVRYIHQNPLKAGMVLDIDSYPHSSYSEFITGVEEITDIDFTLGMLSENKTDALKQFKDFHHAEESENFEISESQRKSPEMIRRIIMSEIDGKEPASIREFDKEKRNDIIKMLVQEKGISKSALERATGISRGTIVRICSPKQKKAVRKQFVPAFLD